MNVKIKMFVTYDSNIKIFDIHKKTARQNIQKPIKKNKRPNFWKNDLMFFRAQAHLLRLQPRLIAGLILSAHHADSRPTEKTRQKFKGGQGEYNKKKFGRKKFALIQNLVLTSSCGPRLTRFLRCSKFKIFPVWTTISFWSIMLIPVFQKRQ